MPESFLSLPIWPSEAGPLSPSSCSAAAPHLHATGPPPQAGPPRPTTILAPLHLTTVGSGRAPPPTRLLLLSRSPSAGHSLQIRRSPPPDPPLPRSPVPHPPTLRIQSNSTVTEAC